MLTARTFSTLLYYYFERSFAWIDIFLYITLSDAEVLFGKPYLVGSKFIKAEPFTL